MTSSKLFKGIETSEPVGSTEKIGIKDVMSEVVGDKESVEVSSTEFVVGMDGLIDSIVIEDRVAAGIVSSASNILSLMEN